jgi:DNA (cytosine-5)-methyltransferase 1
MNVLSLFAGIGGLDLGLERAGMTVVGQVEIDPFCQRVLAKHWPEVPRHDDVRTCVEWWLGESRPAVDVICGGFPCQPVSLAGRRKAQDDERWLWPLMASVIGQLRPRFAILENVPGLFTAGFADVLADLAALGFDAEWDCVPAAAVGAPHRRDRLFLVAHASSESGGIQPVTESGSGSTAVAGDDGAARFVANSYGPFGRPAPRAAVAGSGGAEVRQWPVEFGRCGSDVANSPSDGWRARRSRRPPRSRPDGRVIPAQGLGDTDRPGQPQSGWTFGEEWRRPVDSGWWATEPDVGRVAHGVPARVDRLRGLGNAVVPQVAEHVGRLVMAHAA